jgi:glycosyltransferase involved in cell wall biosynthesis
MGGQAGTISVVMPAHDEEPFLEAAVRAVAGGLAERGQPLEVLVVENGSTDGTAALARRLEQSVAHVKALSLPEADYGRALRAGFLHAEGEVVAFFDVDYYDLAFLDLALARLGQPDAPAIVVGAKRAPGAVDTRAWSRRLVTSGFSLLLRAGFGLAVSDTHGMKVLRRLPLVPLAEACRLGTDLFDTELVLRAQRAGLVVTEIPVRVSETRPSRTSILGRIPRTLLGLARLRLLLWTERTAPSPP